MQINYAIVFVSDMKRSLEFYRDKLGIPLRFESPVWTELETEGATLALHVTEPAAVHASAPGPASPGQCRPGFRVADLDALHARLVEQGVECVQAPKDLFGARTAQYRDPDGLVISIGEARK